MWSEAAKSSGRRASETRSGFLLAEVLVALVVAGLFFGVLSRAFSLAWGTARTPMDVMSAIAVARSVAVGLENDGMRDTGRVGGYSFTRSAGSVNLEARPSQVAPAPPTASTSPSPDDKHSEEAPVLNLRRVTVAVRAPSGRRVSLDSIQLRAPVR